MLNNLKNFEIAFQEPINCKAITGYKLADIVKNRKKKFYLKKLTKWNLTRPWNYQQLQCIKLAKMDLSFLNHCQLTFQAALELS